jgi:hypothetical protein
MEKVIGLVLSYKTTNYGSQLQAYATQYVIEKMGYATKIITYVGMPSLASKIVGPGFFTSLYYSFLAKRKRRKTRIDISDEKYKQNNALRKKISEKFINDRLKNIRYYSKYSELVEDASQMAAVLIGSDQKWGPGFCYNRLSTLDFVPNGVRRISYATSLGVSEYPMYCRKLSKKMWEKIDCLSVREKQGAELIKEICGAIPVEVVVDPTYLITKNEWKELVPFRQMENEDYVFCYFLGNDDEEKNCAKRFAEKKGLKVISIMSNESFTEKDNWYADKVVMGASPEDFINWIRGASYIFTDSFHGLAFSVINEKQFYIFYRKRDDTRLSRNSRIDNILNLWGIEDRLIIDMSINWNHYLNKEIDYQKVREVVLSEREKSLNFLRKSLS